LAQGLNGTLTGNHWQTTTYNYNGYNNELSSSVSNGVTSQFSYDPNGNLVQKTTGSTSWNYTWNVPGQLLRVGNNTGYQGYYAYDGLGRRVESKENSYYVFYGYLGTETLAETGTFGPDNDYVYANGLRIAMVNNAAGSNPTVVYYHTDALGSTRLVTSATKSVLFSDSYQPFGIDNSVSGSQTYKFTGKPVSQTTGLYYNYQRWYDPSTGRFISQDPLAGISGPGSLNPYVYVRDSPTVRIDPSGLDDEGSTGRCSDDSSCGGLSLTNWEYGDPSLKGESTWGGLEGASNELTANAIEPTMVDSVTIEPITTETITLTDTTTLATTSLVNTSDFFNQADSIQFAISGGDRPVDQGPTETGYKFVSTQNGYVIRVPENWGGRVANNGQGLVFQKPGASGNANTIRIMDPTTDYPKGYVVYYNQYGQPLDPDGLPTGRDATHIPLDYEGSLPKWP